MAPLQAEGKVIAEPASQPTVRAVPGGHLGGTDTEGSSGAQPWVRSEQRGVESCGTKVSELACLRFPL